MSFTSVIVPSGELRDELRVAAFELAVCPVTQAEWVAVMGWNRSTFPGPRRPVEGVSWFDAVRYCNAASARAGLPPAYEFVGTEVRWDRRAAGYRLATEVEWEHACRAGSHGRWCFGDDPAQLADHAWYGGGDESQTAEVGHKRPNQWGLHDMHGLVWEWVWDWYGEPLGGGVDDDQAGPPSGRHRVQRGGTYWGPAEWTAAAHRFSASPKVRDSDLGFRVARSLAPR